MIRDLFSHRGIQVALIFVCVFVSGSLLYSWHVKRTTDALLADTPGFLQGSAENSETRNRGHVSNSLGTDTPSSDTHTHHTDEVSKEITPGTPIEGSEPLESLDAFLPEDFVSQVATGEEVPVSPFGFGPYPDVPDGFSLVPSWQWSEERLQNFGGSLREMELIDRVLIKLWNQGDREWKGAKLDSENGKVYPLYRNLIYVTRWIEVPVASGKTMPFPAGGTSGGSDWKPDIINFVQNNGQLPAHIRFVDAAAAGYNPYDFLNIR